MNNNFIQRVLTGILFLVVMIAFIIWSRYTLAILFYVIGIAALLEFFKLTRLGGHKPYIIPALAVGSLFYLGVIFMETNGLSKGLLGFCIPLLVLIFIFGLYTKDGSPLNSMITLSGVTYALLPFALINTMALTDATGKYNGFLILAFFIIIWTNDSLAYVFGSLFGKHKLIPGVSPGKTWEGTLGGILSATGLSFAFPVFFGIMTIWQWVGFALIVSVSAVFGDLAESSIKRYFRVKDSGNLLPGHGGILDRFDSVTLAGPIAFSYLILLAQ